MHEAIIRRFTHFDGADILAPLIEHYFRNRIALVSSFGAESAVLLHMVSRIDRSVPVIFLDTQKLFWETILYRSKLVDLLGLSDIRIVKPDAEKVARHDAEGTLNRTNPDLCCKIRKSQPLAQALSGFDAWIAGRKRFHGGGRQDISPLEVSDGRLKVEPLARFTAGDIEAYLDHFSLPRHPLVVEGYRSIGCIPCTIKGGTRDNPRSGRWAGTAKTECGIHWSANGVTIRQAKSAIS